METNHLNSPGGIAAYLETCVEDVSSDAGFLRDVINDAIRALRRLESRAHQRQKGIGVSARPRGR
jgi:hypothetical protein